MTANARSRLLLDRISVYGAMIDIGCRLLADGPMPHEQFRGFISPGQEEETAAELVPFLVDSGMVDRSRGQLRLSRAWRPDWTPQLNLLALLHARTDTNYVFRFVWEALLDNPEWAGVFVNRDELWPVVNQVPVVGASLPPLNSNRMASWMRIASWIGLIQPERSNSFVLVPTEDLVCCLLTLLIAPETETALAEWVAAVESQFCRVTMTPGHLHPGFSGVLAQMVLRGQVEFRTYSDEHLLQVGAIRASHIVVRKGVAA